MQPYGIGLITNGGSLTTTSSFQNIPNLSQNVVAGGTYRWWIYYQYQGSSTTAVFQPTMGGTCTATFVVFSWRFQNNANGATNTQVQNALGAPTVTFAGTAVNAATTNYGVYGDGLIVVNAAGTLTAQAAFKSGTAACTVQTGGYFYLEQLA